MRWGARERETVRYRENEKRTGRRANSPDTKAEGGGRDRDRDRDRDRQREGGRGSFRCGDAEESEERTACKEK
eukprot:765471-Hanusia_phi.AAC.3